MYHEYMAENRPLLVTTERTSLLPILIIDKSGALGIELARKLYRQFLVVLVSPKIPEEMATERNIIHIPYRKKIPLIPDNIYSHVFLYYNGEEEMLDMLPSFMKKANESAGKLFFITSLFYSSPSLFKALSKHIFHHLHIVLYGEIFDNDLLEENLLTYFIFQARLHGRIEVPSNGSGHLYPVHLEDLLTALIAVAFSQTRTSRVLFIFPKHEISETSVARIIQKIHPHFKVDYRKYKRRQPQYYIPQEGAYCFPDYNLEARLRDIDFTQQITRGERVHLKKTMQKTGKQKGSPILIIGIILLYFIILPGVLIGLFSIVGVSSLQMSIKEAEKTNFASAKQYIAAADFSFSSASTMTEALIYLEYVAASQKHALSEQLSLGKQVTEVASELLNSAETMQKITDGKTSQPKHDFLQALAGTKNSLLTLQKLKAEHKLPQQIEAKMTKLEEIIILLENTGDTYPVILGFEGKKKYLVLFQNNMELRPGGGFIGSYGLLSIENGKYDPLQIYDVYDADGKLTTHIEPPYGLRRYLGAAHWFLRDSNFDPDFTKNAQMATNFLQLETNEKVDGVIAVDTEFLHKVLKAIGSVKVEDYNETVTADNFYMLTQTHAEKDFFPGSSQKKDFLRSLFNAITLHIQEKKQISVPLLSSGIIESIKGKHVMVAFSDIGLQEVYTVNNLSGAMWDARSQSEGSILDYLGVIDANIGANKTNYYLKRVIDQKVSVGESDMQSTVTVTYENTSKKDSPFGGDYKNYVRFLLPNNAQITSVLFDNQVVKTTPAIADPAVFTKTGFLPPAELELEETTISGKRAIGFVHQVPAGSKKTIAINFTIPQVKKQNAPELLYNLRLFKQPGTVSDPFSLIVAYPSGYGFLNSKESGGVDIGGKVSYQTKLDSDKDIIFQFSKK